MLIRPGIRVARIVKEWRDRAPSVKEFAAGLGTADDNAIHLFKVGKHSFVGRASLQGRTVVVKWRELFSFNDRVKCAVGASRSFRQWRGARMLARAGIPAARPLALLVQYGLSPAETHAGPSQSRANPREWLILECIPGKTVLQHLADRELSLRDQHALARAVGVQAGAMLRAGLCNRDHKPSNVIASFEDGVPIVTLVDTVAIRRRSNPGEMVRMLATLLIESIGVGVAPRGAIAFRVLRDACAAWLEGTLARPLGSHPGDRKALRALIRSTARRIDQYVRFHGDPTPKDNPLSEGPAPTGAGGGPKGA
ncbi:MAG: hypothetical protein KF805_14760 [Phycisphaeraceae bacterium]|nr:hypothetical protein [Phycisphaeraceae bacterium]